MNEYIDRDRLLKTINENVAESGNERCAQILEAILNAPTVDVAPKSEVAKEIFDDLEKFIVTRFVYYGTPEYDVSDKYIEVKKKYGAYVPVPIKTLTNSHRRIIRGWKKSKLNESEDTE